MEKTKKLKKGFNLPHVYILLMTVMAIIVVLSWIVPSGEFAKIVDPVTGRSIIDPNNFSYLTEKDPITFMDFFTAIHTGIVNQGNIIVMLLMAVGTIYLAEKHGAIGAGIHKLLEVSEGKEILVIGVLTLIFAILGAIGMGEGGLPFIPLSVTLVMALGYDKITGIATSMAGMGIGFASGILNMYTTGISQTIVGLPIFSGIGFRTIAFVIFYLITMVYIVSYAKKIKKDPSKSVVKDHYKKQLEEQENETTREVIEFTTRRKLTLICIALVFVLQAFGALKLKWGLPQISALYIIFAVVISAILKLNPSQACVDFAYGASRLLPAALAIGIASSVMVLMNQAKIIDTAIYSLSLMLNGKSPIIILLLVYVAVIIFNFFVISGSGKAVILMPILGPLGQLVHINQQVMVLIFNYGDGFTNYVWPTSGGLMAGLAMADVEYQAWIKFAGKLFFLLSTVSFGLIILANYINLGPF